MAETYNTTSVAQSRTLLASSARSAATGAGDSTPIPPCEGGLVCLLDATDISTGNVADKLDVFIETKIGSLWHDIYHFTQVDATVGAGAERWLGKLQLNTANAEYEEATALAEASGRNFMGDHVRARWAITAGGGTNTFTFSVVVCPM
jgi:hypothetical protein